MKTLPLSTILALRSLPRFGRKTVRTLLMRYCDDIASPPSDDLRALLAIYAPGQELDQLTTDRAICAAQETMEETDRIGIRVLTLFDDAFPTLLRDIPDPPIVLFVKGSVRALRDLPTVAVIGTREPTKYGELSAQKLGKRFAERGLVVVSGLAKGCDAFAHEGCVEVGGVGIAVMAHGLDTVYPADNRPLAEKLLACGGCLVSEYPPGMKAHRGHFVERDRLQSGLARGVVVVETDVTGGTMHTVGFAREQHRPLACIVHPPQFLDQPKVQGNQLMIKSGDATPLADASDLERFVSILLGTSAAAFAPDDAAAARTEKNGQRSWW